MIFFRLFPVILSCLLLGAHFSRANFLLLSIFCGLFPVILFIKNIWIPRLMQLFLYIGTMEWLRTLLQLIEMRQATNQPWIRLAIIIGTVALFTILSSLAFQNKTVKERYRGQQ